MTTPPPESTLLKLCRADAIEEGEALRVEVAGRPALAVFHVKGQFYTTNDTCSHGDASLTEGFVEGEQVECPWHSGRFCLKTGSALTFPAVEPIKVYSTLVRDGDVYIHIEGESN